MRLLIDAGNSRLKWRFEVSGQVCDQGVGAIEGCDPFSGLPDVKRDVSRIAVSVVASEEIRLRLLEHMSRRFSAPVTCYWAEASRSGLHNAYQDCSQMGADRWHAMYGAWQGCRQGFVVIDAGSAITVDYVRASGRHLGGYILPGLNMMRRSLQVDAARIGFDSEPALDVSPGGSTSECVNHGSAWLTRALIERIQRDSRVYGINDVLVTGGDAARLVNLGLAAEVHPALVMDGLALIDSEVHGE